MGIDDPVEWMNNTDPKILDLWTARYILETRESEGGAKSAEQSLQELVDRWQTLEQ